MAPESLRKTSLSGATNSTGNILHGERRARAIVPLVLFAACRAWAASLVVLPVALDQDVASELGRLTQAAESSALRSGRWEIKHLYDALDPEHAQHRATALSQAKSAFKLGQKFYQELDARRALGEFDKAVHHYEEAGLNSAAVEGLRASWTMKIASLIAMGDHNQGQVEIQRLLAVAPDAQFSPNFFPPDEIAWGEKTRGSLALRRVPISLSSQVPGSVVFLDGRYLGKAPVQLAVPGGEHFFTVHAPGFSLWQKRVEPGNIECVPESAASASPWLNAARKIAQSPRAADRDAAAVEFAQSTQADQVLLLTAKITGASGVTATALRLDRVDGHLWAQGTQSFLLDAQLEEHVEEWLGDLLARDRPKEPRQLSGNRVKRNVGYIALGSAAALLAGGIFFGIQASNEHSTFRSLPQTDPNANAVRSSGRTYAIAADLMFVGALAAGVSGSYFSFFFPHASPPRGSERSE